jgi:hypothetical protein
MLRFVYETFTHVFPVIGVQVGMITAQDDAFD